MTHGGGRAILWSSFNQARKLTDNASGKSSEFFFGAARERVKQLRRAGSTLVETTVYAGGLYEKVVTAASGLVEHKHYIVAPTGRIAVHTERSDFTKDTRFFHTDGLGSVTVVTDERGQVLKRYAYDAWGKQSTPYTATGSGAVNTAPSTRGYTDHEMLSDLGLIHMNGRVYDPVLGRFLSADPHIDDARDSQGFNRYSYVGNNPMNATDPTGYFKLKDALKIVAIVAVAVISGGAALAALTPGMSLWGGMVAFASGSFGGLANAIIAGAAAGFGSGFAGTLLNGGSIGDAFKAGVIGGLVGGITGGLTYGIGSISGKLGYLGTAAAHGIVQGGVSEAVGGKFRHGFYSGFAASSAGGQIGKIGRGSPWGKFARVAAAAVVGGTASAVGGGKFANGAVSGAFVRLFNEEAHPGKHVIVADDEDIGDSRDNVAKGEHFVGTAYATKDASSNPKDTIVIFAQSAESAVAQMKEYGLGNGSVSKLSLVDHGARAGWDSTTARQMIGDKILSVDQLKLFEPYLAPNAIVVFYGCFVGCNAGYLADASAALGARAVYGPNALYEYSQYYDKTHSGKYTLKWRPLENPVNSNNFIQNK